MIYSYIQCERPVGDNQINKMNSLAEQGALSSTTAEEPLFLEHPRSLVSEWSQTEQILVADPKAVKEKLAKMKSDKSASLVADFDFSLTREFNGKMQCDGSFTVFRNPKYISKEFMENADALHAYYRPIEMDTSRSV